jgi:hypothetical protein
MKPIQMAGYSGWIMGKNDFCTFLVGPKFGSFSIKGGIIVRLYEYRGLVEGMPMVRK